MFRGCYEYSIDVKGRVSLPAKFRKALTPEALDTIVIVRAPDNCLRAYPLDTWNKVSQEIQSRPETPETTRLQRYLFGTMSDSQLDSQGRITITEHQRRIAGIDKKVLLVGQGAYIEIWSPERYEQYVGSGDDFDSVYYQSVRDNTR